MAVGSSRIWRRLYGRLIWFAVPMIMLNPVARALAAPPTGPAPDDAKPAEATVERFPDRDEQNELLAGYKKELLDRFGLSYSMQASAFGQATVSHGSTSTVSTLITPAITWAAFSNPEWGSGTFNLAYIRTRFLTRASGDDIGRRIGLAAPLNEYGSNQFQWSQLTYTHAAPGDVVSATIGQFSFYNFDNNEFASSQQTNFSSYVLALDGSLTYANAGLGAYVQVNPTKEVTIATGLQGATNLSGEIVTSRGFEQGRHAVFGYAAWTPEVQGLGAGQYSFLYYRQPAIAAVPAESRGVSFNAVQHMSPVWAVFLRANGNTGRLSPIRISVAAGAVVIDPFGHSAFDQAGLGLGVSAVNADAFQRARVRAFETVGEAYYNYTVTTGLQAGPSLQVFANPALAQHPGAAAALSLRVTASF